MTVWIVSVDKFSRMAKSMAHEGALTRPAVVRHNKAVVSTDVWVGPFATKNRADAYIRTYHAKLYGRLQKTPRRHRDNAMMQPPPHRYLLHCLRGGRTPDVFRTTSLVQMQKHLMAHHGLVREDFLRVHMIAQNLDGVLIWGINDSPLFMAVEYGQNPRGNPFHSLKSKIKRKCQCHLEDCPHVSRFGKECPRDAEYGHGTGPPQKPTALCEQCLVEYIDTYGF